MKKIILLLIAITLPSLYPVNQSPAENSQHIVYHPDYDITFFGLEKIHPFDSSKYSKVANALVAAKVLNIKDFYQPKEITDHDLLLVHDQKYLHDVYHNASAVFTKASELSVLFWMPNFLIRWKGLYPMRLATGGTVAAMELALKNKWAINLSGGYHHAKADDCGGFCIYNDAAIAAYKAIHEHGINKILVIDLDAHQGNGNEAIFGTQGTFKNKVDVFDVYGANTYPGSDQRYLIADQPTWYNHPVSQEISDADYMKLLRSHLPSAIEKTQPELIIYNAGTDILDKDPVGHMQITKKTIIERDEYVFSLAKENNIPIVMMLSGGYTSESAGIIANSIKNIIRIMEKN